MAEKKVLAKKEEDFSPDLNGKSFAIIKENYDLFYIKIGLDLWDHFKIYRED